MSLVSVRNLHVTIPTPAGPIRTVDGVDLHVERGQSVGIVGEAGSGKSVTSLALMRLLSPNIRLAADDMRLDNTDLLTLSERRMADIRGNRMTMIFQEPMRALNLLLTVGRQMTEGWLRH